MAGVAVAIICKTPAPGASKTRLSPPLQPDECAAISACFIRDLSKTIDASASSGPVRCFAVYTPVGSEADLKALLPASFGLIAQGEGDLGARLLKGMRDLLAQCPDGAILINSDSPTLPMSLLAEAVDAVLARDQVVLCPAIDGGYTLIGLSKAHARLFEDIAWSTDTVYQSTLDRAAEIGVPVCSLPAWYDVDDAASLAMLASEMRGATPAFADRPGADAGHSRSFLAARPALQQALVNA